MPRLRAIRATALASILAACAAPAPDPKPTVVPPPAASTAPPTASAVAGPGAGPVTIDGLYQGTSTRFRAERRDCPHPGLVTLYVQNRQFDFRWTRDIDISGLVQPDGSLIGQNPAITLDGRLAGGRLEGDVSNSACGLHFTAVKES
jgi:hypothetical protein